MSNYAFATTDELPSKEEITRYKSEGNYYFKNVTQRLQNYFKGMPEDERIEYGHQSDLPIFNEIKPYLIEYVQQYQHPDRKQYTVEFIQKLQSKQDSNYRDFIFTFFQITTCLSSAKVTSWSYEGYLHQYKYQSANNTKKNFGVIPIFDLRGRLFTEGEFLMNFRNNMFLLSVLPYKTYGHSIVYEPYSLFFHDLFCHYNGFIEKYNHWDNNSNSLVFIYNNKAVQFVRDLSKYFSIDYQYSAMTENNIFAINNDIYKSLIKYFIFNAIHDFNVFPVNNNIENNYRQIFMELAQSTLQFLINYHQRDNERFYRIYQNELQSYEISAQLLGYKYDILDFDQLIQAVEVLNKFMIEQFTPYYEATHEQITPR